MQGVEVHFIRLMITAAKHSVSINLHDWYITALVSAKTFRSAEWLNAELSLLALFSFTSSVYSVDELANGEAEVIVQIRQGNLTTDVQVTVETTDGGTATGKIV